MEDNIESAPANGQFEQIELDAPFKRGNKTVSTITIRKPKAGELRGVALTDLMQMDVTALSRVLPRVSEPVLTEKEIAELEPADLVQLGGGLVGFLLPKRAKLDDVS